MPTPDETMDITEQIRNKFWRAPSSGELVIEEEQPVVGPAGERWASRWKSIAVLHLERDARVERGLPVVTTPRRPGVDPVPETDALRVNGVVELRWESRYRVIFRPRE